MVELAQPGAPLRSARLRLSAALWRRPWLKVALLLALPAIAFLLVYLGSLAALFISAFWQVDSFTGKVVHVWTTDNFHSLIHDQIYRRIALRTIGMAAAVTVTDAVLAFPLAFFMARVAPPRTALAAVRARAAPPLDELPRPHLLVAADPRKNGALNWALNGIGLPDAGLAYTNTAMWIVFSYVWLPFMILPVYAALERIPDNYLEASADLGARGWRTLQERDPAARPAGHRRRLDLHLLADARRLHHARARRRGGLELHRQRGRDLHRRQRATSRSRPPSRPCR